MKIIELKRKEISNVAGGFNFELTSAFIGVSTIVAMKLIGRTDRGARAYSAIGAVAGAAVEKVISGAAWGIHNAVALIPGVVENKKAEDPAPKSSWFW